MISPVLKHHWHSRMHATHKTIILLFVPNKLANVGPTSIHTLFHLLEGSTQIKLVLSCHIDPFHYILSIRSVTPTDWASQLYLVSAAAFISWGSFRLIIAAVLWNTRWRHFKYHGVLHIGGDMVTTESKVGMESENGRDGGILLFLLNSRSHYMLNKKKNRYFLLTLS